MKFMLDVDAKRVFEFKMKQSVTSTPDMPIFNESMGEIASFIEGPWVVDLPEIEKKIKLYEKGVRDKRNAPRVHRSFKRI